TSSVPDLGGGFDASFSGNGAIASNGSPIQNRLLLPTKNGLLYLWPTAPTPTDTDNIAWSTSTSASAPTTPQNLFSGTATTTESINDWNACNVSGANDAFDELRFDGSTWSAGAPIPNDPGKKDSGVVLASDGASLLAFVI